MVLWRSETLLEASPEDSRTAGEPQSEETWPEKWFHDRRSTEHNLWILSWKKSGILRIFAGSTHSGPGIANQISSDGETLKISTNIVHELTLTRFWCSSEPSTLLIPGTDWNQRRNVLFFGTLFIWRTVPCKRPNSLKSCGRSRVSAQIFNSEFENFRWESFDKMVWNENPRVQYDYHCGLGSFQVKSESKWTRTLPGFFWSALSARAPSREISFSLSAWSSPQR